MEGKRAGVEADCLTSWFNQQLSTAKAPLLRQVTDGKDLKMMVRILLYFLLCLREMVTNVFWLLRRFYDKGGK